MAMKMKRVMMEKLTRSVVRRTSGLVDDDDGHCPVVQFDSVYQTVADIAAEHRDKFADMAAGLRLSNAQSVVESFDNVVDKLFTDGRVNGGRLLTLLAFAGHLCTHGLQTGVIGADDIDAVSTDMGRRLADYVDALPTAANVWVQEDLRQIIDCHEPVSSGMSWKSVACAVLGVTAQCLLVGV